MTANETRAEREESIVSTDLEALIRAAATRYGMRLDVTDLAAVSRACERPSAGTAALARAVEDRPLRPPPRRAQ